MREFATVGRFSEHADVAVTAPVAFDYVTDQSTLADWNDHVTHAEVIDGGAVRLGSRLRQQRRRDNREFDLTFEVTAHEPPRRHTVKGTVFGVDTTMEFTFEPRDAGTRVTMAATVKGRSLRALLAPLVTREMHKSTVTALQALQRQLGAA
jgi:hypothetical protein